MSNINTLPPEILVKIFSYFDIKILFKIRLVCKNFRDIVANVKITELVFEDLILSRKASTCIHQLRWYEINKKLHNVIKIAEKKNEDIQPNYNLLKATKYFNLKNLKRLRFAYQISEDHFDLECLNKFEQLEILQFQDKYTFGDNKQLILPNLKILYVNYIHGLGLYLTVPKLEILASRNGLEMLRFKERPPMKPKSEQVKEESDEDSDEDLSEILKCMIGLKKRKVATDELEMSSSDQFFSKFDGNHGLPLVGEGNYHGLQDEYIKNLPNLKEIHIMNYGMFPSRASFTRVKETIRRILKEKKNLNRNNTQIFLNSRLVSTIKDINNFDENVFYHTRPC